MGRPLQLNVGVANVVPKLIVYRLVRPATKGPEPVHLVCRDDNTEQLVAHLATHALDVVITDTPAPAHLRVKVFSHLLGESDTAFFAPAPEAARLRRRFPRSLHDAPVLLPTPNTALRHALGEWFDKEHLRPRVVGEFEDSALMKVFGQSAGVASPAPSAIEADVCRLYGVRGIGRTRLTGERGQKGIHRPELEEVYGFDTKYAMHMLRLGFQGVELLTTGRLSLPMREPARAFLLDVRRGKVSEQECLTRAGELEQELTDLATTSPLPEEPDEERVEEWVLDAYRRRWAL